MSNRELEPAFILNENQLSEVLTKELGKRAANLLLVPKSGNTGSTLAYDWRKAKAYYQEYCERGNDCPSDEFSLDCTHFVCHGLDRSNIKVNSPEATCDSGLCIRVAELAAAFRNSAKEYSNVKKVDSLSDTKEGDYCFVVSWFGLSKDHAMVLAQTVDAEKGKVWGHTNSRCGRRTLEWEGQTLVVYRVE